ncbi:hypothetical protein [Chitinophaga horti]|uniref:hypothetical protein n=1 Tax=Chitinophaga horti TaxID=2920382 RepID=UPI002559C7ED|nr:hypothetical protein [Chitinophaga horti]
MAYVENIVAFMEKLLVEVRPGYELYNYADKPDLSTKELVDVVYGQLGKKGKVLKVPYFVGYCGGLAFDILSKVSGKKYAISSIRVKKFCATTQFDAGKVKSTGFITPYSLEEGLRRTISSIRQSTN